MGGGAKLLGVGVVTALGRGKEVNVRALKSGFGLFRTCLLEGFEEPLQLPYLSAANTAFDETSALDHLEDMLEAAVSEAFSDIELSPETRQNLPLFIGSSSYGIGVGEERYKKALDQGSEAVPLPLDGFTQVTNYLRRRFSLLGPDFAYNTACTSSANALLDAAASIEAGHHPYALVVGIETYNRTTLAGFHGMQLLATDAMKPFDKFRQGLVLGEGCGVLLLKAGDMRTGGVSISGGASRCDTFSISASNPDGSQIARVMGEALKSSGLHSSDIRSIKAHGTGSPLNDNGEAAGMRRLFDQVPPFFSMKAYIGHTLGACGAIETALMTACLTAGQLPASAGFECPDESLGVEPITRAESAGPGSYMLNFFGFGGNNCSLLLRCH